MVSLDEALAVMLKCARSLTAESVPLEQAHGRILADPVVAAIASPRSDCSAMDGYAVREKDVFDLPATLRVSGESYAGTTQPPPLGPGEAVRIFTGAPVPESTDRVVVQENCVRAAEMVTVRDCGAGRHIRSAGQDFREGDVLLPSGTLLTPRALVAASASDQAFVTVVRRPRVAILGTGDELVSPGEARGRPGTVPDSVSLALAGMIADAGGEVVRRVCLPDDMQVLTGLAREALSDADVVVVTGGASVGERDYARAMFGEKLDLLFSKVAMKPGKPVWLGRVGRVLVVGLPGNPTSAMVTARVFLVPLVTGLAGRSAASLVTWRTGIAGSTFPKNGARETLVRARWVDDGLVQVASQDSSNQSALVEAEVLIRRGVDAPEVSPGEKVAYIDF